MRPIDADALLENYNLKDATKYGNRDAEQQANSYSTMMLYEVADMIEDAPTIEAVPVMHGEWIKVKEVCGIEILKCSVCNEAHARTRTAYCCDCGAKMDGKAENH